MSESSSIGAAQSVARVRAVRLALLTLHKTLIDTERARYEQSRGRVGSPHDLLALLMRDPFFAWLQPMSQLIVDLDEWLAGDGPHTPEAGAQRLRHVRDLVSGGAGDGRFRDEYQRALQRSPAVVVAHGRVQDAMEPPPPA